MRMSASLLVSVLVVWKGPAGWLRRGLGVRGVGLVLSLS
jgi:hypothetical protein